MKKGSQNQLLTRTSQLSSRHGKRAALLIGMMPSLIETPMPIVNLSQTPLQTREQAVALLQDLRRICHSLSSEERSEIKTHLVELASAQFRNEFKEK